MDALYRMLKMFILLLLAMVLVDVISFIFTNRFICRGMRQYKYILLKGCCSVVFRPFKGSSCTMHVRIEQ